MTPNSEAAPLISDYQQLQAEVQRVNAELSRLQGVQAEKKKQFDAILAKYGCKSVEELEALSAKAKTEAEALVVTINSYLAKSGKAIADMNALMAS